MRPEVVDFGAINETASAVAADLSLLAELGSTVEVHRQLAEHFAQDLFPEGRNEEERAAGRRRFRAWSAGLSPVERLAAIHLTALTLENTFKEEQAWLN